MSTFEGDAESPPCYSLSPVSIGSGLRPFGMGGEAYKTGLEQVARCSARLSENNSLKELCNDAHVARSIYKITCKANKRQCPLRLLLKN
jgi:hypothetical protein